MSGSTGSFGGGSFSGGAPSEGVLPDWMKDPAKFQRQLTVGILSMLFIYLLIHLLRELRSVLQPLFIALFVCYLLLPLHHWVVRRGVPRKFAFIVILAVFAGIFYGLGVVIYADVESLINNWHKYQKDFTALGRNLNATLSRTLPFLGGMGVGDLDLIPQPTKEEIAGYRNAVVGGFFDFFISFFVVLIYIIFLLLERSTFKQRLDRALGERRGDNVVEVARSINHAVSQYLIVKTISSIATGLAAMVVLVIFGVDFFVMWGILTFLLNFIPYVGCVVASAFPIMLCFVQYNTDPWWGVLMAVCLLGVHQIIGNVIEPRFLGSKLHVSPLLIVMSLAFWGMIWGVVGMILAIPILVTVQIVLNNIRETRPLAILMSNE